jgi:hypothetical protein
MESIFFNVDRLAYLHRTELAQCLQEAEFLTGDTQRAAAIDPATLSGTDQQRQDQVETQHKIFEC